MAVWLFAFKSPRCRQTTATRLQGRVGRGWRACHGNGQNPFWRYDSLKKSLQDSRLLMDGGQRDVWCVNCARCDFFQKLCWILIRSEDFSFEQIGLPKTGPSKLVRSWASTCAVKGCKVSYENHLWITLRNSMPFNHFLKTKYQQLESFLLSVRVHPGIQQNGHERRWGF